MGELETEKGEKVPLQDFVNSSRKVSLETQLEERAFL